MRTCLLVGLLLAVGLLAPGCAEEEGPPQPAEPPPAVEPDAAEGAAPPLLPPLALRVGNRGGSAWGAVAADSNWTMAHVCADGHWSAAEFDLWVHGLPIDREPRLPGRGEARHDVTVTAMSLCAYLGAGWTHRGRHRFAGMVDRGLRWLRAQQQADGRIGPAGDVRAHAWATLALTEAYGMTGSGLWYASAKRALAHLIARQAENGAWPRASASREDDALGTFLASLCLKSLAWIEEDVERRGRPPVFDLDPDLLRRTRDRFRAWLDAHQDPQTGRMTAPPRVEAHSEEHPLLLTAAGLLARIHLGADPRKDAVVRAGAAYLAKHPPSWDEEEPTSDLAYVWFGTLALFQVGGQEWKIWNEHLKTELIDNQHKEGAASGLRGSWDPRGAWVGALGRVGATALATLCLEVYYRYDKVFGDGGDGAGAAPVAAGTWRRSALPPHTARFEDRDGTVLPIESARLAAEIHGVRARVVLDLWVRNPSLRQREGRLRLRLPDGAAPYYLAFGESAWERAAPFVPAVAAATDLAALRTHQTGDWGSVREARMAPTARARKAYDTIVSTRRDPALLTWAGDGVFDLGVFPLLPRGLHRVVLGYEVDLTPVGEEYELALHLPDDVPDVAAALAVRGVTVRTVPDAPVTDGLRRWIGPAQREIRVLVRAPASVVLVGADDAEREHTAVWVQPEIPEATRVGSPGRGIFLLDTSASGRDAPYGIRLQVLEAILTGNRDELKEFALGAFDSDVRWWRDGFVPNTEANVEALLAFARGVELAGATDLGHALAAAAACEGPADVFLLSDGTPTWGVTEEELGRVPVGDAGRRIFAYRTGLGGESARNLHGVVSGTGGALIPVLGPGDVRAASRAHRHGVWELRGVELPGVTDLFVVGRPQSVHYGQRLRLVGRGRPAPGSALRIDLERGPQGRTLNVALPPALSSAMAARAYGYAAVVELEALGRDRRRQALAYASHFRVVREAASLVMLETEEDYARHGLAEVDHASCVEAEPVVPVVGETRPPPRRHTLGWGLRLPGLLHDVARGARCGVELPPRLLAALATVPADRRSPFGDLARDERTRELSRAAGSRLEDAPGSLDALLGTAFDAWDAGHRRQAYIGLCAAAARHPGARLLQWQLARMAADLGFAEQALVWFELSLAWAGAGAGRQGGDLVDIVAHDYARFLRNAPARHLPAALNEFARARALSLQPFELLEEADLVVLLAASVASPDVELCILRAGGSPRYRTYDTGTDGSYYVGTDPDGLGPKMFVAPQSAPAAHDVEVVLPPGRREARSPPVQVRVVLVRNWGRATERAHLSTVVLSDDAPRVRIPTPPR